MTSTSLLTPDVNSARPKPFAHLATVSLTELNAQAALQTRVDRKYLVAAADLPELFGDLPASARLLEIEGRHQANYRSTYFDTASFASYLGAARSRPNRFKVRVRTYVDTDAHYLEVKTRNRNRQTTKVRREAEASSHERLDEADQSFVTEKLTNKRISHPDAELTAMVADLRPTLSTHYERSTLLVEPTANEAGVTRKPSRATIDTGLAFTAPGKHRRDHSNLAIIETKTVGPRSLIDQLLWRAGHRPLRVSKYAVGLALFHPDLPTTKWNRVLRRDFDWRPRHEQVG